jgi:hypothetical protein
MHAADEIKKTDRTPKKRDLIKKEKQIKKDTRKSVK